MWFFFFFFFLPSDIIKKHYGVFGFNLFQKGEPYSTVEILGDDDGVDQWASHADHQPINCARAPWVAFAAVSEFDYLFINTDAASPDFGATRRIVNNCFEDVTLTPAPIDNFLHLWHAFSHAYVAEMTDNFVAFAKTREGRK